MSRNQSPHARTTLTVLLAASLLGLALWNNAGAAKLYADPPTEITLSGTPLPTDTPTNTYTLTPTPPAPAHIVISEFRTRGLNGEDDEFVELYNPSGGPVDLTGWTIRTSSGCGSTIHTLVTIPSGVLHPGQHYLAVSNTDSSITDPDHETDTNKPNITFNPGIDDNGGIGLISPYYGTVDQVGMCIDTYYGEGTTLEPLTVDLDQSYERKPGGDTSCYDTKNNSDDFALINPSDPQNKTVTKICTGVVTYTPTKTPTITPTRTPTPRPTSVPGNVVINEFLPHPHNDWNSDGTSNVFDEYIEIINLSTQAINVQNWRFDTGAGSKYYKLPDLKLQPRQIAVFYRSETEIPLSDGGSTVRLLKYDGSISDAFTYPTVEAIDQTWCRMPDGGSTWGFACRPTPGRPNAYAFATTPVPGYDTGTSQTDFCQSINNVPDAILQAECGSYGGDITGNISLREEKRVWIKSRLKWGVYVQ